MIDGKRCRRFPNPPWFVAGCYATVVVVTPSICQLTWFPRVPFTEPTAGRVAANQAQRQSMSEIPAIHGHGLQVSAADKGCLPCGSRIEGEAAPILDSG